MKIGIYLGYAPYIRPISLRQEGLGRYLSFLLKGFTETGNSITIACPIWVVPLVEELFEEEDIDTTNIELLTPSGEPVLLRGYVKWVNRQHKPKKKKNRLRKAALSRIDGFLELFLHAKTTAQLMGLLLLTVLLGILALPFAIVGGLLFILLKAIKKVLKKLFRVSFNAFHPRRVCARLPLLKSVRKSWNAGTISERVRQYSAAELIRRAKRMKAAPDVWYSPSAFWKEFNSFPGVRVVCAPDLVTTEFPGKFSQGEFQEVTDQVSKTIVEGQYFVTYCNYLRDSLLVKKFYKEKENVAVIQHAQNDMSVFLNLAGYFKRVPFKENPNLYFAKNIVLPGVLSHSVDMGNYLISATSLNGFSFKDVEYIFYPSQVRGNKNMLNLVKAYEYLLRTKNIPVKLILTCNMNYDGELKKYIYENRLQYDILCFSSVSAQQLAALYMCARLVVNPTLYEGGFPFTFGEGMSVGTPSVMSNIPQVMEVFENCGLEEYLFDPYDYRDMAAKIESGLTNRESILEKESCIYEELSRRTWGNVCEEYVQAFEHFIDRSKKDGVA